MPKDFLLEIGTEPMPARFCRAALDQLLEKTKAALEENRLGLKSARVLGTYRRFTLIIEGVEDKSPSLDKEVQGPPARLLKGPEGKFTPQADGFARKQGIAPEDLTTVSTPKGEFLLAKVTIPGEPAAAILARVIPEVIGKLEFPKTLEWEETRFRFGRPIRSLTALLGKSVVPFKLAGIKSNRFVSGLAAQSQRPVSLSEPSKYVDALRRLLVLVDPEERRQALVKRLEGEAKRAGGALDLDADLVEETLWLTEHPAPVAGTFKTEFLELPAPLLSLVLKKQLKFFPLLNNGKLISSFLGVRDGVSEGQALVREGYQRVISARLSDAVFFFGRDKAATLGSRLALLERVTYQRTLGSMRQKTERVEELSRRLCELLRQTMPLNESAVGRIARLCYSDLVTDVVKEFPELQGAMGGVYARLEKDDERIALGLEQFYYPLSAKSPIPMTAEGALVSLAGKLDTLAGNFAIGNVPTGSADPYALRRQASGLVRIALEKQFPIDLDSAFRLALEQQPVKDIDAAKVQRDLSDFVWTRAQTFFEEKGFKVDETRAVRAGGLANLAKTYLRLAALASVRKVPEFEPLSAAFKRASNILKQAKVDLSNGGALDRDLLKEEAELALYDALVSMEGDVNQKLLADGYEPGLRAMVSIKPHLDFFFDKVMVMAEDKQLREQRLRLLAKLVKLFNCVADLSELQPSGAA